MSKNCWDNVRRPFRDTIPRSPGAPHTGCKWRAGSLTGPGISWTHVRAPSYGGVAHGCARQVRRMSSVRLTQRADGQDPRQAPQGMNL